MTKRLWDWRNLLVVGFLLGLGFISVRTANVVLGIAAVVALCVVLAAALRLVVRRLRA